MTTQWNPDGWRQRPALQMPEYADAAELSGVLEKLRSFPPLVIGALYQGALKPIAKAFLEKARKRARSLAKQS